MHLSIKIIMLSIEDKKESKPKKAKLSHLTMKIIIIGDVKKKYFKVANNELNVYFSSNFKLF